MNIDRRALLQHEHRQPAAAPVPAEAVLAERPAASTKRSTRPRMTASSGHTKRQQPRRSSASMYCAPGSAALNAALCVGDLRRNGHAAPRGCQECAMVARASMEAHAGRAPKARTAVVPWLASRAERLTSLQAAIPYASRHDSESCGPTRHCRGRQTGSPASLRGSEACGNHSGVSRASRCAPEVPARGGFSRRPVAQSAPETRR